MFYEQENGLKGQYNLAQGNPGKTGSRAGLENGHENRPCENVYQRETLVSDEGDGHFFPIMMFRNSVRKDFFALFIESSRTAFLLHPLPGATFRFVPPSTCPGLNYIGLSGREISGHDLCVKSSPWPGSNGASNYSFYKHVMPLASTLSKEPCYALFFLVEQQGTVL